jgi:RNA polymerase sigma-70 factor (ECF subfamily)
VVIERPPFRHHSEVVAAVVTVRSESPASPERQARLAAMIDGHYRLIWRMLRRLGIPAHAVDDATQQVFLVAAERLDDIKLGSERAFAFGTALRVAQTLKRRAARETADPGAHEEASTLPGPDELSEQRRARAMLDRLLEQMPIELRTVLVLFELEGMTSPEIAEVVAAPLGTVASRLRRARELFHTLVEHERTLQPRSDP